MSSFTPANMAEQNHIGLSSSGVEPVSVPSDGRIMTASSIGSTSSLSEIDSQSGSLTDEPYHELLQLLQLGAPPPVKWTCVRCEVTFTSSCALLNHHVTSCLLGNIPSTTVLSTPTMVAMLRQVDPEHPVDGEPIWWVDSGDDGEEEKEEQNSEEEDWNEELGMEEFPVEAPLWLSDKQKTEWHTKRNRKSLYFSISPGS